MIQSILCIKASLILYYLSSLSIFAINDNRTQNSELRILFVVLYIQVQVLVCQTLLILI